MTPTVEEIVKGLTASQKRALVDAVGGGAFFVTRWKYGRSVRRLHSLGLTYTATGHKHLIAALTPLGLSVRTYLESMGDGNG